MGCLPACFRHLRSIATTKRVQDQCLSPINEQQELLKAQPTETESYKEEEIANPTNLVSQSKDGFEDNHSNIKKYSNELASDELVEKETTKSEEREDGPQEFLKHDKGCLIRDGCEEKTVLYHSNAEKCSNELASDEREDGPQECEEDTKEANLLLQSIPLQEESCGSLFSLSIDSRKHFLAAEIGDKEVNSPLKIKNNTQFEGKENVPLSPMIEQSCEKSIAVETSLSSWLVEKSPRKQSTAGSSPESEKNYRERLVLGVIASPIVKEVNGFSSAASTPCCSGDSQLALGTVGRYWRRRGLAGGSVAEQV